MTTPKKPAVDWERVELDFRAGILSLREIALAHGVSHVSVSKRAKRDGWTRDLSAKIKAKAEELVNKALVNSQGNAERLVNEKAVIDAGAAYLASIRSKHRQYNERLWANTMNLVTEAEAMNANPELYTRLGELMSGDPEVDMLRSAYRRTTEYAGRVDTNKKLAETMKLAQAMERETNDMAPATQKVDLTAKVESSRKTHELTDDELFAIATGGSKGVADPSQGTD